MSKTLEISIYFGVPDHQIDEFLEVLKRERKFAIGSDMANIEFSLREDD